MADAEDEQLGEPEGLETEFDDESDFYEDERLTAEDVDDIVLYTLDWSVQSLLERIGTTFDINPAFQRRAAWTRDRKSLYIESLILGLPVPQIVLAEDREMKGRFLVLDGKQRLVTMKQFADPSTAFPAFRLGRLHFLHDLENMTFEEIRSKIEYFQYAESILSQPVRTIVVRNWEKEEVLYHIFVRLNEGSVKLSPQELRQALFPGDFTRWVDQRSASSAAIHAARRLRGADFRMRDAEMLLRFVALQEHLERANSSGVMRNIVPHRVRPAAPTNAIGHRDSQSTSYAPRRRRRRSTERLDFMRRWRAARLTRAAW